MPTAPPQPLKWHSFLANRAHPSPEGWALSPFSQIHTTLMHLSHFCFQSILYSLSSFLKPPLLFIWPFLVYFLALKFPFCSVLLSISFLQHVLHSLGSRKGFPQSSFSITPFHSFPFPSSSFPSQSECLSCLSNPQVQFSQTVG